MPSTKLNTINVYANYEREPKNIRNNTIEDASVTVMPATKFVYASKGYILFNK